MRRVVLALTLAIATCVFAADTWVCFDGCTDEAPLAASTASGCALCQRGLDVDRTAAILAPPAISADSTIPYVERALPLVTSVVDHPPRAA